MEKLGNLTPLIKINTRVTTSQYEISGKNSHLLRKNVFIQSIVYPSSGKTIYWKKYEVKIVSCLPNPLFYTIKAQLIITGQLSIVCCCCFILIFVLFLILFISHYLKKSVHGPGQSRGPWTPDPCFILTPVRR